jgi:transcription elongation factor GreA
LTAQQYLALCEVSAVRPRSSSYRIRTIMQLSNTTLSKLVSELEELLNVKVPAAQQAIEAAKGAGDNSQNNDYFIAAAEEAQLRGRVLRIERSIAEHNSALEAHGVTLRDDVVTIGVLVEIVFDDGETEEYLVGSIEETGAGHTVVTPESPLGSGLLGGAVGDTVTWETPSGAKVSAVVSKIRLPA